MREIHVLGQGVEGVNPVWQVNGLTFELNHTDYTRQTTMERILLCKPERLLRAYVDLLSQVPHGRILELGIFEGGSALFFASLLKRLKKIVSIDLRPSSSVVENIVIKQGLGDRVRLYYETPQDSLRVRDIALSEFGSEGPQIIIDDCSHCYGPTRASFEMLFPLLMPGGLYIIEDWAWAHWPGYQNPGDTFYDEPALSNLIFEILALRGTHQDWFEDIVIKNVSMAVIQKGRADCGSEPLDITSAILLRGRTLPWI